MKSYEEQSLVTTLSENATCETSHVHTAMFDTSKLYDMYMNCRFIRSYVLPIKNYISKEQFNEFSCTKCTCLVAKQFSKLVPCAVLW